MTSLIYLFDESQAIIATDTLSSLCETLSPHKFTTKTLIVPHLKMIICGTGAGGFADHWFLTVNKKMIVPDIDYLDYHTPVNLNSLWQEFKKDFPPDDVTANIYHFGFSKKDDSIHAYVYRSTSDFKSERIKDGMGYIPECTPIIPKCTPINPLDAFPNIKKMMREQREIQSSKSEQERINIGGEIQIHYLSKNGFNVFALERFEDYDAIEAAIYENYDKDCR